MSDTAVNFDLSGTPVPPSADVPSPDPAIAPVPPVSSDPVVPVAPTVSPVSPVPVVAGTTTPAPPQIQAAAPAEPQPTLSKELADAVDGIVRDLSGVDVSAASLLRFVPRLASVVHTLQIRGGEKRDLVLVAAHVLVSRVVPEGDRPAADALVDAMFPPAIAAVIDVVAGRVTFQQVVATAAAAVASNAEVATTVVASTGNCLTQMLSACLRKN